MHNDTVGGFIYIIIILCTINLSIIAIAGFVAKQM